MKHSFSISAVFFRVLDTFGALILALYAFLIGPLGFLRGPLVIERFFWYLWVFIPLGVMSRAARLAIEWRLGHFDVAINQAEGLLAAVESYYQAKPYSRLRLRVLNDLYVLLTRAYMHAGRMDEAMQVVLRAKKNLGLERLSGLSELDAKSAHLIRAALAAGKLLEGGGLATMFVKSPKEGTHIPPNPSLSTNPSANSRNEMKSEQKPPTMKSETPTDHWAKVIPFPQL